MLLSTESRNRKDTSQSFQIEKHGSAPAVIITPPWQQLGRLPPQPWHLLAPPPPWLANSPPPLPPLLLLLILLAQGSSAPPWPPCLPAPPASPHPSPRSSCKSRQRARSLQKPDCQSTRLSSSSPGKLTLL